MLKKYLAGLVLLLSIVGVLAVAVWDREEPLEVASGLEQLRLAGPGGAHDSNDVSFRIPALATREIGGTTYQVCGYQSSFGKVVLGWRVYPFGRWTLYHYDGTDKTDLGTFEVDAHNTVVVEIDADGLVHFCFDMHNDPLNYRRSDAALGTWAGGVTAAQSMLGTNESSVTYPMFFRSPTGTLYFMFRDRAEGSFVGNQYLYAWNDSTNAWAAASGTSTAGLLIQGASETAYLNGAPKFSSDWDGAGTGFMHFNWMWATGGSVADRYNIVHARWNGSAFSHIDGTSQTVPITTSNCDTVWAIGPSVDLFNQCDFDLDANNRPVVAVIKNDASSISQLYALYYDGSAWQNDQITSYVSGTYAEFGRPIVLLDRTTNIAYFIGGNTNDSTTDVFQWTSDAGDFTTWTQKTIYSKTGYGGAEVNYDRKLWLDDRKIAGVWTRRRDASTSAANVKIIERRPKDYSGSTFPTDWQRKHAITIPAAQVGSGGTSNFSVWLARANFDNEVVDPSGSNAAQTDGGDLVFTSDSAGTTRLPCHVVKFEHDSTTGAADAEIEIKVSASPGSVSSNTIYVWYNTAATEVQPFVDETNGQYSSYSSRLLEFPLSRDQQNNAADALPCVNQGSPGFTAAKIVEGMDCNGAEGLTFGNLTSPLGIANAFSMAAWVNVDAVLSDVGMIISADSTTSANRNFQWRVDQSTGLLTFIRFNSSGSVVTNITGTTDLRGAGWKRVWATFDTTNGSAIYVDGALEASDAVTTANNDTNPALRIGYRVGVSDDDFLKAIVDQVEIHTARRDAAWITTDYNNQNAPGTFATAGAPESTGSAESPASSTLFTRSILLIR